MEKTKENASDEISRDMIEKLQNKPYSDLIDLIYKRFGNEVKIGIDFKDDELEILAMLGKKAIHILYNPEKWLIASVDKRYQNLLQDIRPSLIKITGEDPICLYTKKILKTNGNTTTLEWKAYNPEARLLSLLGGTGIEKDYRIRKIALYGGRNLADYQQQLIYGIYPGFVADQAEKIKQCDETTLFFIYVNLSVYLNEVLKEEREQNKGQKQAKSYKKSLDNFIIEIKYALDFIMLQASRFGINAGEPREGKKIKKTSEFKSWINEYDEWFNNLSEEEKDIIEEAYLKGIDLSSFKPDRTTIGDGKPPYCKEHN